MASEISDNEMLASKESRGLEFYLGISQLNPTDIANKVIMNLGAGRSDLAKALERIKIPFKKVVNIDLLFDEPKTIPNSFFIQADMCNLPLADSSVDIGFATWSLSRYLPIERQKIALAEILRVLKSNGKLFIHPIERPEVSSFFDPKIPTAENFFREHIPSKTGQLRIFRPKFQEQPNIPFHKGWTVEITKN